MDEILAAYDSREGRAALLIAQILRAASQKHASERGATERRAAAEREREATERRAREAAERRAREAAERNASRVQGDDDDSIAALVEAKRGEGFVRKTGLGGEVRMRGRATFPSVRAAYAAKDALLEHPAVEFLSWGSDYDLLFKP